MIDGLSAIEVRLHRDTTKLTIVSLIVAALNSHRKAIHVVSS